MKKYLRLLTVGAMLTGRSECVDYKPKIIGEMSVDQMREIVDVMLHNHRFLMVMFQQVVTTPENAEFGNVNTVTAHAYSGMYSSNPGEDTIPYMVKPLRAYC